MVARKNSLAGILGRDSERLDESVEPHVRSFCSSRWRTCVCACVVLQRDCIVVDQNRQSLKMAAASAALLVFTTLLLSVSRHIEKFYGVINHVRWQGVLSDSDPSSCRTPNYQYSCRRDSVCEYSVSWGRETKNELSLRVSTLVSEPEEDSWSTAISLSRASIEVYT